MVELTKMDGTRVWLGTAVCKVEVRPNFAHDKFLEVDLLVNPLDGHCDVLDAGGDQIGVEDVNACWLSQ